MATVERIKQELRYEDGALYWRRSGSGRKMARAGFVRKRETGARGIRIDGRTYSEHSVIWAMHHGRLPQYPHEEIDHINCDVTDNRIENLRLATKKQNQRNKGATSRNSVGYKGVTFCRQTKRYRAMIRVDGEKHPKHLGRFDTPIEAAKAYRNAAKKHHGEFARWEH